MAKDKKTPEKHQSELLRRFKANPGLVIGTFVVLAIVIVAFVAVPAITPDRAGGNADLTFGYYDKVPITYVPGNFFAQYRGMVEDYRRNSLNENYNENYSLVNYQIWREAYEAAAVHTAMLQEMKKAGYTAPEKIVDRNVAKLPQFQDNGRFSLALYRRIGDNERLSIWRQIQDDTAKDHFRSDVVGLLRPSAESKFIANMAAKERSFDMAVFSVDSYPESEYQAYINEHPELFRSVHLSKIAVDTNERDAKRILDSIKSGETTFDDAARAYSKDNYADRGGDMGVRMIHELIFEIPDESTREQLSALTRNEYTDIIKSSSKASDDRELTLWSFFRAEENIKEADPSDPIVMEKVHSYVRNYERGRMEDWAIAQADNFIALANKIGFEAALSPVDLVYEDGVEETRSMKKIEKRSFGPIPLNYGNVDLFTTVNSQSVSELSGVGSDENFWRVAFSTPVESPSKPVVQGSNVLVLFPSEQTEAEESSIESIVNIYNSYWLQYASEHALQQHFLNSPKMEDKFIDIYFRYFMER
jgi:hypothetical protein